MLTRSLNALAIICTFGGACSAQNLTLDAFWAGDPPAYDQPLDRAIELDVVVQLTNTGKEKLTVFCRKERLHYLESNHSNPAFDGFVIDRLSYASGLRGIRVIPSVAELLPVVLSPGEATEFRCPVRIGPKNTLEKIRLRYSIDDDLARRFGAWFGDLEAPILRQRMWRSSDENKEPNQSPERNAGIGPAISVGAIPLHRVW